MKSTLESAVEQLALVKNDLITIPGVTGVDVGYKYVNGIPTDEVCIRVYVNKKKKEISNKERIPAEINGIKTDVIEATFEPLSGSASQKGKV